MTPSICVTRRNSRVTLIAELPVNLLGKPVAFAVVSGLRY
jgi:hypothetical protein